MTKSVSSSPHLYSFEIEKNCLAGMIKFPMTFLQIENEIKASDFVNEINRYIFPYLLKAVKEKGCLDPTLISDAVSQSGYSPKADLTISDYLDSLKLIPIAEDAVVPSFRELKKYSICRDLYKTTENIQQEIKTNLDKPIDEIVTRVDVAYGRKTDLYKEGEANFVDVFGSMQEFIDSLSNNPVKEKGIPSPFKKFNEYYGGFRDGDVYVWASRAKQGKSTLLSSLGFEISQTRTEDNKNIKVLYLDTEMLTKDFMLRLAASMSGVPFWYVDTGNFITNAEYKEKIKKALKDIQNFRHYFYHKQVGNLNIDQIIALIYRWYYQYCSDGKSKPVIIYDYLKLTNEKVSGDWKEYQVMGEKVNKLKEVATKIGAPLLSAIQINRSGVTTNKDDIIDDETVISLSDRITWFASYVGIFRRNSKKEMSEMGGLDTGTHRMITLNCRFQGKLAPGHDDLIKAPDGTWKQNYISFTVNNFKVTEGKCLKDIIKDMNDKQPLNVENEEPHEELI